MGLTGIALNNVLQFTGLKYSTITNCTLIAATGPAVTALIATICIRERLQILQWVGIAISFVGVIFWSQKALWISYLILNLILVIFYFSHVK